LGAQVTNSSISYPMFIDEFRNNEKVDLATFAEKVQRKISMCPDRFILGRARKAAMNNSMVMKKSNFYYSVTMDKRRGDQILGQGFFLGQIK
jgi:hypothetical protein